MTQISSIVLFSLIAVISAEQELQVTSPERKLGDASAQCTLAITAAVTKVAQIGTTLWATIDRCEKAGENEKQNVLCTSDLFSIMQHTLEMSQWVMKSVEACGGDKANKCSLTSLKVTEAISGLTSASLAMSQVCDAENVPEISGLSVRTPMSDNVDCNGHVAGAIGNLGVIIARFQHMTCSEDAQCFAKSLDIVAGLVDMGNAIWQAATQSCIQNPGMAPWIPCANKAVAGASNLLTLGSAAVALGPACASQGSAYYDTNVPQLTSVSGFSALIAGLAALFSLTAIAAVIRRSRTQKDTRQPATDMETQPLQNDM
jgi:hypothetical protein